MKNLIWLASYPKSGNTWLRVFLTNLLLEKEEPANINKLIPKYWANDKSLIEKFIDVEPSEITADELLLLRPKAFVEYSKSTEEFTYLKIHDAYFLTKEKEPIVPTEQTFAVIYIVRNPIDVCVSLAHHQQESFEDTIDFMNSYDAIINQEGKTYQRLSTERLCSWSQHVESWTASNLNVLVVKYEDMYNNQRATFIRICEFLKLNKSILEIEKAIQFSNFKLLKEQENKSGFLSKKIGSTDFFRKGKIGSGKKELSQPQIDKILSNHKTIMEKYNYEI